VRDSFDVVPTSVLGWPIDPLSWQITLDPSEEIELEGTIEIADTLPNTNDIILCEAISISDPVQSDSSWLNVLVADASGLPDRPEKHVFALMHL
jgi:hypothetical protein